MNNKKLINGIRILIAIAGVFATFLLFFLMSIMLHGYFTLSVDENEFKIAIVAYSIIIVICAIPCYWALSIGWRVSEHMEKRTVISRDCTKMLETLYRLALFDVFVLGAFTIFSLFNNWMSPLTGICMIVIIGLGCIFAMIFKVANVSLLEAVELREESELTI